MAKRRGEFSFFKLLTGSTLAEVNEADAPNVAARQAGKTARAEARQEGKTLRNLEKTEQQAQKQEAFANLHDSVQSRFSEVGAGILGLFGVKVKSKNEQEAAAAAAAAPSTTSTTSTTSTVSEDTLQEWAPYGFGALVILLLGWLLSGQGGK